MKCALKIYHFMIIYIEAVGSLLLYSLTDEVSGERYIQYIIIVTLALRPVLHGETEH